MSLQWCSSSCGPGGEQRFVQPQQVPRTLELAAGDVPANSNTLSYLGKTLRYKLVRTALWLSQKEFALFMIPLVLFSAHPEAKPTSASGGLLCRRSSSEIALGFIPCRDCCCHSAL